MLSTTKKLPLPSKYSEPLSERRRKTLSDPCPRKKKVTFFGGMVSTKLMAVASGEIAEAACIVTDVLASSGVPVERVFTL